MAQKVYRFKNKFLTSDFKVLYNRTSTFSSTISHYFSVHSLPYSQTVVLKDLSFLKQFDLNSKYQSLPNLTGCPFSTSIAAFSLFLQIWKIRSSKFKFNKHLFDLYLLPKNTHMLIIPKCISLAHLVPRTLDSNIQLPTHHLHVDARHTTQT